MKMDNDELLKYTQELNALRNKVSELTGELFKERSYVDRLLRICKERANAERDIHPKKTASGYVLISSVQVRHKGRNMAVSARDMIFNNNADKKSSYTSIYRTTLQTPYDYRMQHALAEEKILSDLDKKLMSAMGIKYRQDAGHNGEFRTWTDAEGEMQKEACGIYSWTLICRKPLWHVCICHTLPIDFKEDDTI